MTTTKKEFTPKKTSAFSADPHNNRGGKGGKKGGSAIAGNAAFKSAKKVSVTKFKGGSGGDR